MYFYRYAAYMHRSVSSNKCVKHDRSIIMPARDLVLSTKERKRISEKESHHTGCLSSRLLFFFSFLFWIIIFFHTDMLYACQYTMLCIVKVFFFIFVADSFSKVRLNIIRSVHVILSDSYVALLWFFVYNFVFHRSSNVTIKWIVYVTSQP